MPQRKWTDVLNVAVNIAVLGVLLFALFRPGGFVSEKLAEHRAEAEWRAAIAASWTELVEGGVRLDDGGYDVGVVEFADYQCPACRAAHERLATLAEELRVGIVLRHMPLSPIHPAAEGAARASICAQAFGRFRSMHEDRLFGTTAWQDERDRALAQRLGVAGTPTFIGRRGIHTGVPTAEDLLDIIGRPTRAPKSPS